MGHPPAAGRSATSVAVPAVPVWTTEPEIAPSCPSYRLGLAFQQVSMCITVYVVIVLVYRAIDLIRPSLSPSSYLEACLENDVNPHPYLFALPPPLSSRIT